MTSTPAQIETAEAPTQEVSFVATVVEPVEAPEPPTLNVQALVSDIAKEYGVSSTTMYNVAKSESELQADPPGYNDGGLACGVVQVHADVWNLDCDELKEKPQIGLELLASRMKIGDAWKYWTPLNCYTFVNTKFGFGLPKMAGIVPNSEPLEGSVAIFQYSNGIKHVAYVTSVQEGKFSVQEANFKPGLIGTRIISLQDPFLVGFYQQQRF